MVERHCFIPVTHLYVKRDAKRANDRLLFGRSEREWMDRSDSIKYQFLPSRAFGFVRWRGDEYGTQTWRVVVALAGAPGDTITCIPGVKPGAHMLLHAFGKTRAKRALRAIDVLSSAHVLHEIHPSYWRHAHARITKNLPIEPYDPEAFAALDRAKLVK